MSRLIQGKYIEEWIKSCPIIEKVVKLEPDLWINEGIKESSYSLSKLPVTHEEMAEAEERWRKFAPLIARIFLDTSESGGIIESKLVKISRMKDFIESKSGKAIGKDLLIKCDSHLPVAGSIKARGGIYEVLKHSESIAMKNGLLTGNEDYSIMAEEKFKKFFNKYSLAVGSTGNLGLSIGIMGSALGFKVTVHMSADAKEWKKTLLRNRGVKVIEYSSDYSRAVVEGRRQSKQDPMSYFVDDEHSKDLFLGYSTAALRIKKQLYEEGVVVDEEHPLFVYLPCGVGGAPGGICFGLKHVFGDNVHCFFAEPTHSPCILLGLATGEHDKICVQDFGIDNRTDADGLAVGTPSGFICQIVESLISGVYTVSDDDLYRMLAILKDRENIKIEPSAAASLLGPNMLLYSQSGNNYIRSQGLIDKMENSTHIAWATGGLFVPEEMMKGFYEKGLRLL